MFTTKFFKTLGPGILFATTAIGVSHLVQSTRAGAEYGFTLIGFVLMAGVYYLCIVPIGVMLRIFGKDPLTKRWDREAESYWIERSDMAPVAQYFKQF